MSERSRRLCPPCGRLACCDDHHPLAAAHVPDLTVAACRGTCHPVLNERQATAGVVRAHLVERDEAETIWAFATGIGDLFFLAGVAGERVSESDLSRDELLIAALGRVTDLVYRGSGEPGIPGPSPRKNDLRKAGRRRYRNPDRSRPKRPPPAFDPATELERVEQLAGVLARALDYLPAPEYWRDIAGGWRRFTRRLPAARRRLYELADRGREADLFECLREGNRRVEVAVAGLRRVDRLEDLPAGWSATAPFAAFFAAFLPFATELATAETADKAEAALDRLRAAVLT